MQLPDPQTHSWLLDALKFVAAFLTGGTLATLTTLYVYRKKTAAETKKLEAEARHIEHTDNLSAGEMMIDALRELNQALKGMAKMSVKAARADALEMEVKLLNKQLDAQISVGVDTKRLKDGTE